MTLASAALLTPDQVEALAVAAGGDIADVIRFAALTGLRRAELLTLTPDRITNGAIILTANTKSGRPRIVPLHPQAAEIAARRLPWNVTEKQLRRAWERARKSVGVPDARFHDCRHAFGSWLAEANTPATVIRDLMGHSTLQMTSRYLHTEKARLGQHVANLPALGTGTDGAGVGLKNDDGAA